MANATVRVTDPLGRSLEVAGSAADDDPYFTVDQADELRAYFAEQGYVVVRGLVPPERCAAAIAAFDDEVRPFGGHIYRQTTARPERHELTDRGFVRNPLLNVQSLDPRRFPRFRTAALGVLTSSDLQRAVTTLLGRPGTIVQSMYFEGNPATDPHQDTYYLDADPLGSMVAAWIAVEDIAAGAGRFWVCPGSHRVELPANAGDHEIGAHHDRYLSRVREVMAERPLPCRAPALAAGDVLFWSSRTVHGSLTTTDPDRSRRSFTAHFIPDGANFLQFQHRVRPLDPTSVNGVTVHRPKDLSRFRYRALFWAERTFPKSVALGKNLAIRALARRAH